MEVVGIGKLDLTADLFQIVGRHPALDSPLGAYVHEYGGLGRTVSAGKHTTTGTIFSLYYLKHRKTPLLVRVNEGF